MSLITEFDHLSYSGGCGCSHSNYGGGCGCSSNYSNYTDEIKDKYNVKRFEDVLSANGGKPSRYDLSYKLTQVIDIIIRSENPTGEHLEVLNHYKKAGKLKYDFIGLLMSKDGIESVINTQEKNPAFPLEEYKEKLRVAEAEVTTAENAYKDFRATVAIVEENTGNGFKPQTVNNPKSSNKVLKYVFIAVAGVLAIKLYKKYK